LPSEASAASSGSRSRARPRGCTVGGRSARALWRRDGRRRRHRRGGARVVDHSDGRRLPDPARRRRLRPHHRVPHPHRDRVPGDRGRPDPGCHPAVLETGSAHRTGPRRGSRASMATTASRPSSPRRPVGEA
jgi:hypothetical protein